jgi:hypothetical protein
MQQGGQKSEAGGHKRDGHQREINARRLDRQIIRNDGADRPTSRQALCEIRSPISVTAPHGEHAHTTLVPAVTGDAIVQVWRYPSLGKRAAWYGYAEKSRAHARSVFPVRSRSDCGSEPRTLERRVIPFHAGLQDIQGRHGVLYGDSLVTQDAAVERCSGTNRLLRCVHALC